MKIALFLAPVLLVAACATTPTGPTIAVMPARSKSLPAFQDDQIICKDFASNEVAGGSSSANTRQLLTGSVGMLLGAGLGAAIGGGRGAAIGAGSGLLGGSVVGGVSAAHAGDTLQDRYNISFAQCMTARGNRVPAFIAGASR